MDWHLKNGAGAVQLPRQCSPGRKENHARDDRRQDTTSAHTDCTEPPPDSLHGSHSTSFLKALSPTDCYGRRHPACCRMTFSAGPCVAPLPVAQQFNSRDDTVLAKRKSTHTMIAGRTQPARALIALNHRRILSMVATVHHYFAKASVSDFDWALVRSASCKPAS